jgi:hypothetical protein
MYYASIALYESLAVSNSLKDNTTAVLQLPQLSLNVSVLQWTQVGVFPESCFGVLCGGNDETLCRTCGNSASQQTRDLHKEKLQNVQDRTQFQDGMYSNDEKRISIMADVSMHVEKWPKAYTVLCSVDNKSTVESQRCIITGCDV